MARDRQRAKQRQAARRAARLERNGDPESTRPYGVDGPDEVGEPPGDGRRERPDGAIADGELADYDLAAGAPPEAVGRSDTVFGIEQSDGGRIPDADELDDEEAAELERRAEEQALDVPPDPAGQPGATVDRQKVGRVAWVISFLKGSWAELQRVQWPGRTQLFTLTGVVLGFVVLAGGYLGLLDFVFYRLIRALLF